MSFDIGRGRTLGLVGETGCGKSTLGRSILGLTPATGGRVWFNGIDVLNATSAQRRNLLRQMQLVFQDTVGSLNPRMTVEQIVAEPLVIQRLARGRDLRQRVDRVLEQVGLHTSDRTRYPHQLSGGQRQRVGIARAVVSRPSFVVCDEPVSALDVSVQAQILNLLVDLKRDLGLTLLFIAHNLAVVRYTSDDVAVMYLGKIVELGSAADVYAQPGHPYTRALLASSVDVDPGVPLPKASSDHPAPVGSPSATAVRARSTSWVVKGGPNAVTAGSAEPTDPFDLPSGCSYHPRCPIATEECRRVTPPLEQHPGFPAGHVVACHHADAICSHTSSFQR